MLFLRADRPGLWREEWIGRIRRARRMTEDSLRIGACERKGSRRNPRKRQAERLLCAEQSFGWLEANEVGEPGAGTRPEPAVSVPEEKLTSPKKETMTAEPNWTRRNKLELKGLTDTVRGMGSRQSCGNCPDWFLPINSAPDELSRFMTVADSVGT